MKILLAVVMVLASFNVHANCELLNWRFHTIAVYGAPASLGLTFESIQKRDGGLLFLDNTKSELEQKKYLQKIDGKYGSLKVGANTVSLDGAILKNYPSVRGDLTYLKTKDFISGFPSESIAILDSKIRQISIAGEHYLPLASTQKKASDPLPGNLAKIFKTTVTDKSFTVVSDVTDYSKGESTEWMSQRLGEKDWELVQIKMKLKLLKEIPWTGRYGSEPERAKINTVHIWLAFLTNNGNDFWYIGNSSGDPCGTDLKSSVRGAIENGSATIGNFLEPKYGLRISNSEKNLVYSFGDADIVYYLNFGKDMVVISNESYR